MNLSKCFFELFFTAVLLMFNTLNTLAQLKYEREVKIKIEEVPQIAKDFINVCFEGSKIKWFKEYGLHDYSFEAKIKYDGKKYSIEFDSTGVIEDIEIGIDLKEIDAKTLENIKLNFQKTFKKYDISKCQLQWTGTIESLQELIKSNSTNKPYKIRYEIVVNGYNGKALKRYEFLFSEDGEIINQLEILIENTDILDY